MARQVSKGWQSKAQSQILYAFRGKHRAALLQLPTGMGKTRIAVRVFRALKKRNSALRLIIAMPRVDADRTRTWLKELKQVAKADFCIIGQQALAKAYDKDGHKSHHRKKDWYRWIEGKRALVVIDEFHKAKAFRELIASAFWKEERMPIRALRNAAGRPPANPKWLLLSATPINPVALDYQLDRDERSGESADRADVEKEVATLLSEMRACFGLIAGLDRARGTTREAIDRYLEDELKPALYSGALSQGTTAPLIIVPRNTAALSPRKAQEVQLGLSYFGDSIQKRAAAQIASVYARLQRNPIRGRPRVTTIERLVLAGVRGTFGGKKSLFGHSYAAPTVRGVKVGRLTHELSEAVKLGAVSDLVECIREKRGKTVVFCVHRAVTTAVARHLQISLGLSQRDVCDASRWTAPEVGQRSPVDCFNEIGKPPFILVTTDVLSETVDLHHDPASRFIIHYELPWSPLRLVQRFGRLWRIQAEAKDDKPSRAPHAFHIAHPFGIEEEILNRLRRRWTYLDALGLGYLSLDTALGHRIPKVDWT